MEARAQANRDVTIGVLVPARSGSEDTDAGLEKQLRPQHPFSSGQSVSKSCVFSQTRDVSSGQALHISFFPSTFSAFALSRLEIKSSRHSVCTHLTAEGFLSHLVALGSAEVQ